MTILAAPIGLVLGFVFYGGLWLTVTRLTTSRHPVLLTIGSFWIRTLIVLAGFLAAARAGWQSAVLCLVGFVAGRVLVSRKVRSGRVRCT